MNIKPWSLIATIKHFYILQLALKIITEAFVNDSILFTAPVTADESSYMQVKNDTAQKVGSNGSVLLK